MRIEARKKRTRIVAKAQKKRKKTKKRESKQRFKNRMRLLKFFGLLVITLLIYLSYCFFTLPDINEAVSRTRQPSTTIIAENGNEVQTFGTVYSEVIRSEELPQYVIDAIVSTEDRRFYGHFGFDIISFTRAMIANVFAGRYAQGGSTITQQVAKNLFLTSQKSIKRKTQELLLAFWLEHKFSKEQILTLYLNRVYLGAGTYAKSIFKNRRATLTFWKRPLLPVCSKLRRAIIRLPPKKEPWKGQKLYCKIWSATAPLPLRKETKP